MLEQVAQGLVQTAVGLDQALLELVEHPAIQGLQGLGAVGLMMEQAQPGRQRGVAAVRISGVDQGPKPR